jgi:hypothetical protein
MMLTDDHTHPKNWATYTRRAEEHSSGRDTSANMGYDIHDTDHATLH